MDKEFILAEIRRTAELNGGKSPGIGEFKKQTGIRRDDWMGKYWARWSEAILEAGLTPNELQRSHDQELLFESYARFALELGHLPVRAELQIRRRSDSSFPNHNSFRHKGTKKLFISGLADFCRDRSEFIKVLRWCEEYIRSDAEPSASAKTISGSDGVVYLAKTRRGYKIGRTDDWEQRLRQIQLHNADDVQLVHLIKTDDSSGVEAYWHRRFKSRRVVAKSKTGRRRNWYNLTADDVRAFKRWKQI